jgi:Uma2 family endonuclease
MATTESHSLLTAQQFLMLPDSRRPSELVRGKVIEMTPPGSRHGQVCFLVAQIVGNYVKAHDLGHVLCNDSGVVTERNPDSVRGADVAYYSYARVPRGRLPNGYLDVPPDIVVEVRSPTDRPRQIDEKTEEYLNAGVKAVCVLDPDQETLHLHRAGQAPKLLGAQHELVLPEIDATFRVVVGRFFE